MQAWGQHELQSNYVADDHLHGVKIETGQAV